MMQLANLWSCFKAQQGAMFGMDARIALIIAAILTAAGGATYMSRLESAKTQEVEANLEEIRAGLERYYEQVNRSGLPENLDELFSSGVVVKPSLRRDPWGRAWEYSKTTSTVRIENTPITLQLAVISSRGKNGNADSAAIGSEQDFIDWQAAKDDYGIKYTSRDVEVQRLQEYTGRAQLIIDKLDAYEASGFLEAQSACTAEEAPSWCTNTDKRNYTLFNYFPRSDADETPGVVYYAEKVLNRRPYVNGNLAEMQQLMIDLGLPAAYAQDPWGRTLNFSGNISGRTDPPFSASICFSFGENCLTSRSGTTE